MRTAGIGQAVIMMTTVVILTSCAATKQYTSKLFIPRVEEKNKVAAVRFLDIDSSETDQSGWVTTDIITGRDTANKSVALDKLTKVVPVAGIDTTKSKPVDSEPVARQMSPGEVRTKRTRE